VTPLERHNRIITTCTRCPRLVAFRTQVAAQKRAAYAEETYWGRPVPGFGDPGARLLVIGLAPGAHGANRTGRPFTGDRSGEWLYRALHRVGFCNQPTSLRRGDGLRLKDCYVTLAVRCVPPGNRPLPQQRDNCGPYLEGDLELLPRVRVILCLGAFAWDALLLSIGRRDRSLAPRPRFAHEAEYRLGGYAILGSYHPSQQNTFTGRLTEPMLDAVVGRARALVAERAKSR
jgi:uracil-DNA glycosylase family 4